MRLSESGIRIFERKSRNGLPLWVESLDYVLDILLVLCFVEDRAVFGFRDVAASHGHRVSGLDVTRKFIQNLYIRLISLLVIVPFQDLHADALRWGDCGRRPNRFLQNIAKIPVQIVAEAIVQECESHQGEGLRLESIKHLDQVLNRRPNHL